MVDCPDDLQATWFNGRPRVGLTAGASAPDVLVQQVIARLRAPGAISRAAHAGVEESVRFPAQGGWAVPAWTDPLPNQRSAS